MIIKIDKFELSDWQPNNAEKLFYRQSKNTNALDYISIYRYNKPKWKVIFNNELVFLCKYFNELTEFDNIEDAKQNIDCFLQQISKLMAFL